MHNTGLDGARKASLGACGCGFRDNGDERRRREHDEEVESERRIADERGVPVWMRRHPSPDELRHEYAEQERRQHEEREQQRRQQLEARECAREEAQEAERQKCAEWRHRNAPHAPHLRAPPASLLDEHLRAARVSFPKAHDPHDGETSPIVRIAPRLAISAGGRPTIISGGPESMKSFVLSEIGLRIASGALVAFDGAVPIKLCGRVCHIDYENPGAHRTRERYHRLGGAETLNDDLDLCVPAVFLDEPLAERLLSARLYGVAVCLIDSIQFGCRHQSERYGEALAMLGRVSAQTGTAMIVILHPVKGYDKRSGLERLDFVTGRELDTVLWLAKDAHQITTIETLKNANGIAPIEPLRVRIADEGEVDEVNGLSKRVRFVTVGGGPARRAPTPGEVVRRRILRALADGPLSGRELRHEVKGGTDRIRMELEFLVAAGVVVLDDEGRHVLSVSGPSQTSAAEAHRERRNEFVDLGVSVPAAQIDGSSDPKNRNSDADLRGPPRTADRVARGSSPRRGESRVTPTRSGRSRRSRQ